MLREKLPKEKEPQQRPFRILILEDQFVEEAREAFSSLKWVEVKVVSTLKELKELEEYEPDLVILDRNVPEEEGKEPQDLLEKAAGLVKSKFPQALVIGYSSLFHHGAIQGAEIGAEKGAEIGEIIEGNIMPVLIIPKELGDKSKRDSWLGAFKIGLRSISNVELLEKKLFEVLRSLPDEGKKFILDIYAEANPELKEALERRLKYTGESKETISTE